MRRGYVCSIYDSYRYKASGANAVDEKGTLDCTEFINVAKDDVTSYPGIAYRTYPSTVNARMEGTIQQFVQGSVEINQTFLKVFNNKLGLPEGKRVRSGDYISLAPEKVMSHDNSWPIASKFMSL